MDFKSEDIIKAIITFIVGIVTGNAGKILDWWRGAPKDKVDINKTAIDMMMGVAAIEKELRQYATDYNEKVVNKNHELQERIDELRAALSEKRDLILKLQRELENCQTDLNKTFPTGDKERGRRGEA